MAIIIDKNCYNSIYLVTCLLILICQLNLNRHTFGTLVLSMMLIILSAMKWKDNETIWLYSFNCSIAWFQNNIRFITNHINSWINIGVPVILWHVIKKKHMLFYIYIVNSTLTCKNKYQRYWYLFLLLL